MKERSKELQEMIKNRCTELQRAYDFALQEKIRLTNHILTLQHQINTTTEAIKSNAELIEKCKQRAEEQNASDIL